MITIITIYLITVLISGVFGLLTIKYSKYYNDYLEIVLLQSNKDDEIRSTIQFVMVLFSFIPLYNIYLFFGYVIMWIIDPKPKLDIDLYNSLTQLSSDVVIFNKYSGNYRLSELSNRKIYKDKQKKYNLELNDKSAFTTNNLQVFIEVIKKQIEKNEEQN